MSVSLSNVPALALERVTARLLFDPVGDTWMHTTVPQCVPPSP